MGDYGSDYVGSASRYNRSGDITTRYVGSVVGMTTLILRLEALAKENGGATALCRLAGLSDGYIGTLKTRMKTNPDAGADEKSLEAIARAANVNLAWLKKGIGDRSRFEETDAAPRLSEEPFADAIAAAFDGRRHTLADLDAARRVASETYQHLRPEADTRAIAATWLDAAAALRRRGQEVSPRAVLAHLSELAIGIGAVSEIEAAANAEADAALRAKGMEPGAAATALSFGRKKSTELPK